MFVQDVIVCMLPLFLSHFPKSIFPNIHIFCLFIYFLKPWMTFQNILFLSKLQVIFHSPVLLDLEFPAAFHILPSIFKISYIFLSLIPSLSLFSVRWHPSKSILSFQKVTSSTRCDKVVLNIEPLAPELSFPGGTIHGLKAFLACSRTIWASAG